MLSPHSPPNPAVKMAKKIDRIAHAINRWTTLQKMQNNSAVSEHFFA